MSDKTDWQWVAQNPNEAADLIDQLIRRAFPISRAQNRKTGGAKCTLQLHETTRRLEFREDFHGSAFQ